MSSAVLDRVWDGAGETWRWLRGVVLGEWEDDRSISQIVTDALAGFVPGIGSIITLRDLIAVIVRLAKHPAKRAEVEEWILLVAMLLPLIITVIGAAAAGVGALVGAELGGFLRAVDPQAARQRQEGGWQLRRDAGRAESAWAGGKEPPADKRPRTKLTGVQTEPNTAFLVRQDPRRRWW